MTLPLFVIHAWGDAMASARWAALADAWEGPFLSFDLPGHAGAPIPTGGSYASADAALYGDRALRDAGWSGAPVVVLGDASSGFGAELLAAAGRAAALVLVDGLGGPWVTPAEAVAEGAAWCNTVFADPRALAPPPAGADVDPRLVHGFPTVWERAFTDARRAAIAVAVLAIETPASPTPADERSARLDAFAGPAMCVEVDERSADAVGDVLQRHVGFLVASEHG